jgi:outer membrane protein TolC
LLALISAGPVEAQGSGGAPRREAGGAGAEDDPGGLTFAEALERVPQHPEVRAPLAAAGLLDRMPRGGPNGYASIGLEAGYDTSGGERSFEGQLTPSYSFILMRQARASHAVVDTRRRVLHAEAQAALLEHQLAVAHAWLTLYSAEALATRLEAEERLLAEWKATLERALRGGIATAAELVGVETEAAEIAQRRRQQESDIVSARRSLLQSLAMGGEAADLHTEGEPPSATPRDGFDVAAIAARLPALSLARRKREDAEAFVLFDVSTFWPGVVTVGANVPLDSRGVTGAVELQLPMTSAQRAMRARDSAEVARAEIAEETARREAEQLVAAALEAVQTADPALRNMREQTIPSYEALVEVARRRRAAGESTVFEVLLSQRRLLAARVREEELAATARWARVRLELLLEAAEMALSEEPAR